MAPHPGASRRSLIKGALAAAPVLVLGLPAIQTTEEEVSTLEDLMREHGVLRRVLLIYDEAIRRIEAKADPPVAAIAAAAGLVRRFVEDYHEKLEENYLFPRFRKAGALVDLVNVLEEQHRKGRVLTADIQKLAGGSGAGGPGRAKLQERLQLFVRMYGPHAAREDTVLFPAFKKLLSPKEYDALGDEFEKQEDRLFGEGGFEKNVQEVAALEKQIGIYDLGQFTPKA